MSWDTPTPCEKIGLVVGQAGFLPVVILAARYLRSTPDSFSMQRSPTWVTCFVAVAGVAILATWNFHLRPKSGYNTGFVLALIVMLVPLIHLSAAAMANRKTPGS